MPNAARDKGNQAERDVAKYLRDHGFPNAERRVVTGWRRSGREDPDLGDIKGTPGLCCQIKNWTASKPLTGARLDKCMAETRAQAVADGAVIPLLIEKRAGHASPGEWWAWLPSDIYAALMSGASPELCRKSLIHPVRTELRYIIHRLSEVSATVASRNGGSAG